MTVDYNLFSSDYLIKNGELGDQVKLGEPSLELKRQLDLVNGVLPSIWVAGEYLAKSYVEHPTGTGTVYTTQVTTSAEPGVADWELVDYNNITDYASAADYLANTTDTLTGDLTVTGLTTSNSLVITTTADVDSLTATTSVETLDILVTGTLTETSAKKYKENVQPLENSLSVINNLVGVSYNKIGENKTEIGLIADDVLIYRPEYVEMIDGEVEGLHYNRIVADLINAVNILTERVYELENK